MNTAMMLEKLSDKYKGKTFQYAAHIHYVEQITFNHERDRFFIKTNRKIFDRPAEEVMEFLSQFEPVETMPEVAGNKTQSVAIINEEQSFADDLVAILKDNISKVQNDKAYIPQATAICNNVNSIINIQKTKIGLLKMANRK